MSNGYDLSQAGPVEETPKAIKRQLRTWAGVAHERDLNEALGRLHRDFERWTRGEVSAFDLNDLVHRYHDGTSREIWKRYQSSHLEPVVAAAVVEGVLRRDELPEALVQHLSRLIEFFEEQARLS
jgi:hypothetical protein